MLGRLAMPRPEILAQLKEAEAKVRAMLAEAEERRRQILAEGRRQALDLKAAGEAEALRMGEATLQAARKEIAAKRAEILRAGEGAASTMVAQAREKVEAVKRYILAEFERTVDA